MKQYLRALCRRLGYDIVRYPPPEPDELWPVRDLPAEAHAIITRCRPYTMTSVERLAALLDGIRHVTQRRIPGDIVECGVWRGGSMMAAALALQAHGDIDRSLYLYDTFEGMPEPTDKDRSLGGESAAHLLRREPKNTGIWCYATLNDVMANVRSTGYPDHQLHFIPGKVEDTIPETRPGTIALLRLDTDWYESTRHELTHLYPLLSPGGVLIIDDYGHWQGARKAVDEYFHADPAAYLHRIDYTGRMMIRSDRSCP